MVPCSWVCWPTGGLCRDLKDDVSGLGPADDGGAHVVGVPLVVVVGVRCGQVQSDVVPVVRLDHMQTLFTPVLFTLARNLDHMCSRSNWNLNQK